MCRESDLTVVSYNDISTKKNRKKTFVGVAFWVVTSCRVVSCYRSLRGTCYCRVATNLSQRTVSTLKHPQPLKTAATTRSISHAFLLFAYFIDFEHVFSSILWREFPIPKVFLMTHEFNINVVSPVPLFSFSLLYLSLPLTVHLVDCKI
jgi:hypothetical protein